MSRLFLKFPGGRNKAFTFSYDDGCPEDRRLTELFRKYNIKGTFNLVSAWKHEKDIYDGFEIASHGREHLRVDLIRSSNLAMDIIKDREALESEFGTIVRGFAYPGGAYSLEGENMLRALGMAYARSIGKNEWFEIPQNFLVWRPTCHHTIPHLFELVERYNNWNQVGAAALFNVWGHSYEFRTEEDWARMEEFIKAIANKDDVWYASNIEICDYVLAFNNLKYSIDNTIIYNPSALDVWFENKDGIYCVKAGQTLKFCE